MAGHDLRVKSGANFTIAHYGPFAAFHEHYRIEAPFLERPLTGKVFLRQTLGFTGMELSLNNLPAGAAVPFLHTHDTHEEAYVFVKGKGQMQIDGETLDVEEGTVVRVATPGKRVWRNNGTEDLYFIVIQAKEKTFAADERDGAILDEPPRW